MVYDNTSLCVAWQGGLIVMLVHLLAVSTFSCHLNTGLLG